MQKAELPLELRMLITFGFKREKKRGISIVMQPRAQLQSWKLKEESSDLGPKGWFPS